MPDANAVNALSPKKRELLELLLREKKLKAESRPSKSVVAPIPRRKEGNSAPVSFIQQRLWFLDQLAPGTPAFNIPLVVRLRGVLNLKLLHQAFAQIIQRHDTLRTGFSAPEGMPLQVISPSADLEIPIIDLRATPHKEKLQEVQKRVTQDCQRSFDLARPPLFHVTLVVLDHDDQVLIIVMNHLVGDFWSIRLLVKELAHLYEAYSIGQAPSLAELPIQYADYATWQREWLQGSVCQEELAYWKNQLAGMPEELDLPLDYPRPAVQSIWGAKHRAKIPKMVGERLRAMGRQQGTSLFMTLLAGWKSLLFRYTGQEDIIVGAPVANRNRSEYENMIGPFVNSVLLRTDVSGDPPFLDLLRRVRTMVFDAFSYQDFPFERLVEVLQPARNMSRNPLYQTDIILQNAPGGIYRVTGMTFEPLPVETGTAQLDLSLDLRDEADGIAVALEYDSDLFQPDTIARMIAHYIRLLEKVAENPWLPLAEIPLLLETEERQLLLEWNKTATAFDLKAVYSELFEKQARQWPHEIAVRCDGQELTYEQLNRRANQLAHLMIEKGAGPEAVVALLAPRGIDLLVGILAAFKAGAAYMPLDPRHPAARHLQVLQQSRAPLIISAKACLPVLQDAVSQLDPRQAPMILVFEELPTAQFPGDGPPQRCIPENLAYVLFTSGSTGIPKGVMIHQRGMINHLLANIEALSMTSADVMAQTASQCFDISVWQFLAPLILGGRVHIFSDEITSNPPRMLREVDRNGITIFETVPSLLQVALTETGENDAPALKALRWLLPTGEAVSAQLCREWFKQYPNVPLMNAYGPSECSDDVTLYPMHQPPQENALRVPIGLPVANLEVNILDANLQMTPIGVPGELCVRGVGVGRGYLGQPDRTAAVFVPDPFSKQAGARMYRSGDRARYLADGHLEFLGRRDFQVKVRGFRIELSEIEAVLRNHEAVQDTAVIVREDSPGDGRLIGYVILRPDARCEARELERYLKERLPEYMAPASFVFLDRLPLTPSGKVDRKALPVPERKSNLQDFVAARNQVEEVLAGMWADILGVERVSAERNLFELGAHSLLVTQVVSRIRKAFAVEPPLRAFFEYPTVAGMAKVIEKLKAAAEGLSAPPMVKVPRTGNHPLSFTQESMWFLDQTEQNLTAYNVPGAVHMDGVLNPIALEAGFNEVLRRHEILRTTYQVVDGRPVQVIRPPSRFALPLVDLTAIRPEDRENEALRIGRENAQRTFDLLRGPVLRAFLMRMERERHLLAVTTHHIAYDMWARELFIYELAALYEQYVKGLPSFLEEPEIQWVDYSSWLRNWMQGEVLERQLSYWRKKLAGAPRFLDLPIDLSRPPVQSYKGTRLPLDLPLEAVRGLRMISRKCGVTQFITVLAAFKTLLYRWAGEEHIVLGIPIANRNRLDEEKLMGFMANTLVFNTDLGGNPTFVELLERVRETSLGAYAHQDLPFELLVQDLQPERSLHRPPIFQVSFNYMLKYSAPTVNLSDLTLRLEFLYSGGTPFEITVNVWETEDGLKGLLEYCTDLFRHSTITRLVEYFRRLMENIVSNPEQRIGEISFLSQSELTQLLLEWNSTAKARPSGSGFIHQQIENQAALNPHHLAVTLEGRQLTYGELDQRSNQFARILRSMGICRGGLVGICMERSFEMVIGATAVLKTGAAYVPLDPDFSKEHLAFIMQDARIPVLLTQQHLRHRLADSPASILCLDSQWQDHISGQLQDALPVSLCETDLACVIYTLDSTGQMKGVMNTHAGIRNHLLWMQEEYRLTPQDRVVQKMPFNFHVSLWELFSPLFSGAQLVLAAPGRQHDCKYLVQLIRDQGITTVHFVPSMLQLFLKEPGIEYCSTLKRVICSGEALRVELKDRFFKRMRCELHNLYGFAEVAAAIHCKCRPEDEFGAVPLGRPVTSTQVYLLDKQMTPVPVGAKGRLYIGGAGLAGGYWKDPDLTAQKFIPNLLGLNEGDRLYWTGDLARYLPDGRIEHLGPADYDVRIREFPLQLSEIEAVLMQHESVTQAAVVVFKENAGDERLIAYIATNGSSAGPVIEELKGYIKEKLPRHMMPSAFLTLERFPLMPDGKVDRDALPAPNKIARAESSYIAPGTEMEIAIAEIFEQVLGMERVGLNDNILDAGGRSMAAQLISRIRTIFSVDVPILLFFENPTVKGLAGLIQALQWAAQGEALKAGEHERQILMEEGFI